MESHQKAGDSSPQNLSWQKLQNELFPEENLLWHGRPLQGFRFTRSDFVGYFFGALFLVLALALALVALGVITTPRDWDGNAPHSEIRVSSGLWALILSPIALFWLGGSQWLDAYNRSRLFYGVTNERVLILSDAARNHQSLTSMRLRDIPNLSLVVNPDGTGSLSFTLRPVGASNHGALVGIGFRLIPEVRKVYTLIRSVQRETL